MLAPYLIGVVTAPLVVKIVKPVLRTVMKASVGAAIDMRNTVAEIGEEIQKDATEVLVKKSTGRKA